MASREATKQIHLKYMIDHVFMPPRLPQERAKNFEEKEHALAGTTHRFARDFGHYLIALDKKRWHPILKMLENIENSYGSALARKEMKKNIMNMDNGNVLAYLIRAQNAGLILRKSADGMLFEMFEISPTNEEVLGAQGKLKCSYPGPAILVPLDVAEDPDFLNELTTFLEYMDREVQQDAAPSTRKARSTVPEERDTVNPRYITELLTGMLRGLGKPADVQRICKRIGDDVLYKNASLPWRRSPLWLLIRVALQTSLDRNHASSTAGYKSFMLFLTARFLDMAVDDGVDSDTLHVMTVKLSRRLRKLSSVAPEWLQEKVETTAMAAEAVLQGRWQEVRQKEEVPLTWCPETLDVEGDTRLSLSNSRASLTQYLKMPEYSISQLCFSPSQHKRLENVDDFRQYQHGFSDAYKAEPYVALMDFEKSVRNHIDDWVSLNHHDQEACQIMADCLGSYVTAAEDAYASKPEDTSLMLLTIFEIWVALDKIAVQQCPLLQDYSPEIHWRLLEPLLLPKFEYLERLSRIEEYLRGRYDNQKEKESIFSDAAHSSAFAVRFFNRSPECQALLQRIQRKAENDRNEKLMELRRMTAQYKSLIEQAGRLDHVWRVNWRGYEYHDRNNCGKCEKENQAAGMRIEVYEWPLPSDLASAKAAVFELSLPMCFGIWRSTTFQVLRDICTPSDIPAPAADSHEQVNTYAGLVEFSGGAERITWASWTKSFLHSHYRLQRFPTTESAVCVNNGLQFRLFDNLKNEWAADRFSHCSIAHLCTLRLPPGSYESLQYTVSGTSHSSNDVLAGQSDCPESLTLHEFIAFATLRAGQHLQWFNILRELRAKSLSFGQDAVHILLAQTALQVGPSSPDGTRTFHVALSDAQFCSVFLGELEDLLESIKASWLERISARTIVMLTGRILASNTDEHVTGRAHALLRNVRRVVLEWATRLAKEDCTDDNAQEFQVLTCEVAAICKATFDVDERHYPKSLRTSEDVANLIHCDILVKENKPTDSSGMQSSLRRALEKHRRLSHAIELQLAQRLTAEPLGLEIAIGAVWCAYPRGIAWKRMEKPEHRWFCASICPGDRSRSQSIHYNILDGEFLIDGKPLGRLPTNIVQNPMFVRVFGQKLLKVIPSKEDGMEYATRDAIFGNTIHLATTGHNSVLRIRAIHADHKYELIPHTVFHGDVPFDFEEDFVHWQDLSNGEVEFRPLDKLWVPSKANWRIVLGSSTTTGSTTSNLRNEKSCLVDIRSETFKMISTVLLPLEDPLHIIVTRSFAGLLSAELPRFNLAFFLDEENRLHSRNYRGRVLDLNQCLGTMFGLQNKLILRPLCDPDPRRMVIIPYGEAITWVSGHHIAVRIELGPRRKVKYQTYKIDAELEGLTENINLKGVLFKVLLHALTAHCLPDPLTGRTGTEEAIHELTSSRSWSFQHLGSDEVDLLQTIANLTPRRDFYPSHLKCMQTVQWSCLPSCAQHSRFYTIVASVLRHANRFRKFNENSVGPIEVSRGIFELLERSARRFSVFYVHEVADQGLTENADVEYEARDLPDRMMPEALIAGISSKIHRPPKRSLLRLKTCRKLWSILVDWPQIEGPSSQWASLKCNDWFRPTLHKTWLSLYESCRSTTRSVYAKIFSLSAIAYTLNDDEDLINTLVAFATFADFRAIEPPPFPSYILSNGLTPYNHRLKLSNVIKGCAHPFKCSAEANLQRQPLETDASLERRRATAFRERLDDEVSGVVTTLLHQWPCPNPSLPVTSSGSLLALLSIRDEIRTLFESCYRNQKLLDHIGQVQAVLDSIHSSNFISAPTYTFLPNFTPPKTQTPAVESQMLFNRDTPNVDIAIPAVLGPTDTVFERISDTRTRALRNLVSEFQDHTADTLRQRYGCGLMKSCAALDLQPITQPTSAIPYSISQLSGSRDAWDHYVRKLRFNIQTVLEPRSLSERVTKIASLWPRLTTRYLLSKISTMESATLGAVWVQDLVLFARALVHLHRAQRLLGLAEHKETQDFLKELENTGFEGWDPVLQPDWLLIQVECRFLLRPLQAQIALEMISPESAENTVMQLNMGEGKSTVILPMIAAALADRKKIVRVVVLKPLALWMFQLLVDRLGGLVNRRVFYLPFSRAIGRMDSTILNNMKDIYQECMKIGGIILAQPEHLLSFKLMGIDRLNAGDSLSHELIELQRWLEGLSRDILDESDEILHVRYQLVYAVGPQKALDDHPNRWTNLQEVLHLAKSHVVAVHNELPQGIELRLHGSKVIFPWVRILEAKAGRRLVDVIANRIYEGRLSTLPMAHFPGPIRDAALLFIRELEVPAEKLNLLKGYCGESAAWKTLLLLRGLLAHGILSFILEKRWRVEYGLDIKRSLLAVPYRAKDSPSLRAEFGHPDVTVGFTFLSYYYSGLSDEKVDLCFDLLLKLDNPALEYQRWVRDEDSEFFPEGLRQLSGVNAKDPTQRSLLREHFRLNHFMIDFYLAQIVFPREAKQFPQRLSTSSWDLAEKKCHVTTGFSGTNENQYLLPLSIGQHDLPKLISTNAKVLTYLLQSENDHYCLVDSDYGDRPTAERYLDILTGQQPPIRVLLDVGAQMLELRNQELAKVWLKKESSVEAAIFFDDRDELQVLSRDDATEPFSSSPYNKKLDQCLVYLDDVHTRGTDLKLPGDSRAAVTLGTRLTKDRLVQACMRMRKLGHGQSLMFFAPPDIDRVIRQACPTNEQNIHTLDILRWVMLETCADLRKNVPRWAQQGLDYKIRNDAWIRHFKRDISAQQLTRHWLQPEAKMLEEMYGLETADSDYPQPTHAALQDPQLCARCHLLGVKSISHIAMEEEQERELSLEVEREQQTERPLKCTPAKHKLHPEVQRLVTVGVLQHGSDAFFVSHLSKSNHDNPWSRQLLVTADFANTIQEQKPDNANDYMRPVNWILSGTHSADKWLVILSPYEVNELLPHIKCSRKVRLHIYTPRVTEVMKSCEDLTFFAIPPCPASFAPMENIVDHLNLFAGQLWISDYQRYLRLCTFLGIVCTTEEHPEGVTVQGDGFMKPKPSLRRQINDPCPFNTSPLPYLKHLASFRRKGQGYLPTHIGRLLHAILLTESDFK